MHKLNKLLSPKLDELPTKIKPRPVAVKKAAECGFRFLDDGQARKCSRPKPTCSLISRIRSSVPSLRNQA